MLNLKRYRSALQEIDTLKVRGIVRKAGALVIESDGPPVSVGEVCRIYSAGQKPMEAEVIGFRDHVVLSMPLYETGGVRLYDQIVSTGQQASIVVGEELLGRVIDGNGRPLDEKGPIGVSARYPLLRSSLNPLTRIEIKQPLGTGIRAIDGMLTLGRGQRVGIFGGSGVGKSTLLGMMARYTEAEVNVIALVGERGREVSAFIENELGEAGLKRSVVVVSTSDTPPLMRIRAALSATAIAEFFRDQGKDVLLVMDSVTRVAMAQREVGLAAGEPPSSKGYTPSVFTLLPRIFERAGNFRTGSITGLFTVLVEGDDMNEPISDAVRGLLDGHIVLSRELAWKNHFPAISVLESMSRLMPSLVDSQHLESASEIRDLLSTYKKAEDLINIGAYNKGSNPRIDLAIKNADVIAGFLRQGFEEECNRQEAARRLCSLLQK